jgi:hypothetical protein
VIETPLARPRLDRVGLDPLHQHVRVDVQQHVEDVQPGSLEALGQLAPVVFPQHRLHGDQVLAGEAGDALGDDGD